MFRNRILIGRFIAAFVVAAFLFMGLVSADNEPDNNTISTAEEIGAGTHSGSVSYMDYVDWYKVENIGDQEIKICGEIIDPDMDSTITIQSCNQYGQPDGQTEIYLGEWEPEDYCHWQDPGDEGTVYIMVEGSGDYELTIEMDEKESSRFTTWWICCIGLVIILIIIGILVGIFLLIWILARKKKGEEDKEEEEEEEEEVEEEEDDGVVPTVEDVLKEDDTTDEEEPEEEGEREEEKKEEEKDEE